LAPVASDDSNNAGPQGLAFVLLRAGPDLNTLHSQSNLGAGLTSPCFHLAIQSVITKPRGRGLSHCDGHETLPSDQSIYMILKLRCDSFLPSREIWLHAKWLSPLANSIALHVDRRGRLSPLRCLSAIPDFEPPNPSQIVIRRKSIL